MKKASSARTLYTLGGVLFGLFSSLAKAEVRNEYGEISQTVARISFLSGEVSFARGDDPDDWQAADRNVPMTLGDRIYTGSRSRIELQVHGGDFVRLGARTDFAALNLTEDTKQFSLKSGVASIRIRRLSDSERRRIRIEATPDFRENCLVSSVRLSAAKSVRAPRRTKSPPWTWSSIRLRLPV